MRVCVRARCKAADRPVVFPFVLLHALILTFFQADAMRKWVEWSKTHVIAELLLVPTVSDDTKDGLGKAFETIAANFRSQRKTACSDLLDELKNVPAAGDNANLVEALEALTMELNAQTAEKAVIRVPSVTVVLRRDFTASLGDVFGGIVSRTVVPPPPKEQEEGTTKQETSGTATGPNAAVEAAGKREQGE